MLAHKKGYWFIKGFFKYGIIQRRRASFTVLLRCFCIFFEFPFNYGLKVFTCLESML